MMIPPELLKEIEKLPLPEVRQLAEQLTNYLREQERTAVAAKENEAREDEFERYLLAKGVINEIPSRDERDEEFDAFEPIEVHGEPLSETIIRERG
jgi:hypothetical protein